MESDSALNPSSVITACKNLSMHIICGHSSNFLKAVWWQLYEIIYFQASSLCSEYSSESVLIKIVLWTGLLIFICRYEVSWGALWSVRCYTLTLFWGSLVFQRSLVVSGDVLFAWCGVICKGLLSWRYSSVVKRLYAQGGDWQHHKKQQSQKRKKKQRTSLIIFSGILSICS